MKGQSKSFLIIVISTLTCLFTDADAGWLQGYKHGSMDGIL